MLSPQSHTGILFIDNGCCRTQCINCITPLVRNTVRCFPLQDACSQLLIMQDLLRFVWHKLKPLKEDAARTHKIIRAECLLTPCWHSQSACTVHRASFPPLQSQTDYLQRCLICLSYSPLQDHSSRSFSLPDLLLLHHNATKLFHIESTPCLSEEVKHFLFLTCMSARPHTRICPGQPGAEEQGEMCNPPTAQEWGQAALGSTAPTCP